MSSKDVNDPKFSKNVANTQEPQYSQDKKMFFTETEDELEESKMMMPSYLDEFPSFCGSKGKSNPSSSKEMKNTSRGNCQLRPPNQGSSIWSNPRSVSHNVNLFEQQSNDLINKQQHLLLQNSQPQNQNEQEEYQYEEFNSEQFSLTEGASSQFDLVDDIFDVEYQLIKVMTLIENSLPELISEAIFEDQTVIEDLARIRFILIQYVRKTILKSFDDDNVFSMQKYQELFSEQNTFEHFLFLEYPMLFDELEEEEELQKYSLMDEDAFEEEFLQMLEESKIQEIVDEDEIRQHFLEDEEDYLYYQPFSPYSLCPAQLKHSEPGPLDNSINNFSLFDDIDKFHRQNKLNQKYNDKNEKKFEVSIRKGKDQKAHLKQERKQQKSNQDSLFNLPSITANQRRNSNTEKNNNLSSLNFQEFVALMQKQKQKKEEKKVQQLAQKKSHFDEILGKGTDDSSISYLKPFIGDFSKKQDPAQTALMKELHQLSTNNQFKTSSVQRPSQAAISQDVNINQRKAKPQQADGKNFIPFSNDQQGLVKQSVRQRSPQTTLVQIPPQIRQSPFPMNNINSQNRNIPLANQQKTASTTLPNNQNSISPNSNPPNIPSTNRPNLNLAFQSNKVPNPPSFGPQNQQMNQANKPIVKNNQQMQTPPRNSFQSNEQKPIQIQNGPSFGNLNSMSPQTPKFGVSQQQSYNNQQPSIHRNPFSSSFGLNPNNETQILSNSHQSHPSNFSTNVNPSIVNNISSSNRSPIQLSTHTSPLNPNIQNPVIQPNSFANSAKVQLQPVTIPEPIINQGTVNLPALPVIQLSNLPPCMVTINNPPILPSNNPITKSDITQPITIARSQMSPEKQPEGTLKNEGIHSSKQVQNLNPNKECSKTASKRNFFSEEEIWNMKIKDFVHILSQQQMGLIYRDLFEQLLICKKWQLLNVKVDKQFHQKIDYLDKVKSQSSLKRSKLQSFQGKIHTEYPRGNMRIPSLNPSAIDEPFLMMKFVTTKLNHAFIKSLSFWQNDHLTNKTQDNPQFPKNIIEPSSSQDSLQKIKEEYNKIQKTQDYLSIKLSQYEQSLQQAINLQSQEQTSEKICLTMTQELVLILRAIKNTEMWLVQNDFCLVSSQGIMGTSSHSTQTLLRSKDQKEKQTSDFQSLKLLYDNLDLIDSNLEILTSRLSPIGDLN